MNTPISEHTALRGKVLQKSAEERQKIGGWKQITSPKYNSLSLSQVTVIRKNGSN